MKHFSGTTKLTKPLPVLFYNKNKCEVDNGDSMLRNYSSRCATERWPLAVWQNLLDITILNAWICYKQSTSSKISRKRFLIDLIDNLVGADTENSQETASSSTTNIESLTAVKRKCCITMCKNKSLTICSSCKVTLCGTHCQNGVRKISLTICESCKYL